MDAHVFDAQLSKTRELLKEIGTSNISNEDIIYLAQQIKHPNMDIIVRDLVKYGYKGNMNTDTSNNLYIGDVLILLCEIFYKLINKCNNKCNDNCEYKNFINMLIEQLNDMSSGMCSQGRIYRILQIVLAYKYILND